MLLIVLQQADYSFITFEEFCEGRREDKFIILRHDVDEMAMNALEMAKIENLLGIKATYNFRIVKQSNKPEIIKAIARLGHEIGYHYEDLAFAEGNYEKAIETFRRNVAYFRQFYPVKTVCMHGSSTSKYDNRDLWKRYKLADEQLLGEPYLSVDFDKIYYISDTDYYWDGFKTAVRDVIFSSFSATYHHTDEIITAIKKDEFPPQAMVLAHTLWTDNLFLWSFIFVREKLRIWLKNLSKNNILAQKFYALIVTLYWRR
ncbi:MAG: hypothetical protein LBR75_00740 [Prevotellaceae bacterium]|nr:hypothetical protein [Prevotellaceae bacterium]